MEERIDQQLNGKAMEIMQAEGLQYSKALKKAMAENPDLAMAWSFDKAAPNAGGSYVECVERYLGQGYTLLVAIKKAADDEPESYRTYRRLVVGGS